MNSLTEANILDELETSSCVWMREIMPFEDCCDFGKQLDSALTSSKSSLRNGEQIYGAGNLVDVFPEACKLSELEPIRKICSRILGRDWGMTRELCFDTPPRLLQGKP